MKKLLALVLATVMVLGMASVALASNKVGDYEKDSTGTVAQMYKVSEGQVKNKLSGKANYGKTFYIPLLDTDGNYFSDSDMVKGATIKQKWDMGKEAIESISIVKKKEHFSGEYRYYVAIKVKKNDTMADTDVSGTITLKKSSQTKSSGVVTGEKFDDLNIEIGFTCGYDYAGSNTVDDTYRIYRSNNNENGLLDDDDTLDIGENGDMGYFEGEFASQGKVLLYVDGDYDSAIAALYPAANLDFVNGNGGSFNKVGTLTLYADPGSYLYTVKADGTLAAVNAEYDEYEEAFKIKTRTLGRYVISDTELAIVAAPSTVEPPVVDNGEGDATVTVPTNPGTGVAC